MISRAKRVQVSMTEETYEKLTNLAAKVGANRATLGSMALQIGLDSLEIAMQKPYQAIIQQMAADGVLPPILEGRETGAG